MQPIPAARALVVLTDVLQSLNLGAISGGVTPWFTQLRGGISVLLPYSHVSWDSAMVSAPPRVDFLVQGAIHVLPGQQGRSWHPLTDFLVVGAIHALL